VKLFSAIQSAAETFRIPAFAGMTEKNSIIKIQAVKMLKMPPVSSVCKDQFVKGEKTLFPGFTKVTIT
jgi:hypothetical protein